MTEDSCRAGVPGSSGSSQTLQGIPERSNIYCGHRSLEPTYLERMTDENGCLTR